MDLEYTISLLIVGVMGLVFGSFLNVVIYRLPRKESIVFPASYCPVCCKPIKYRDNIPVLSYVLLGGQCRSCSAKISWVYPVIELITACMALILFLINGLSINFIADFSLGVILLVSAMIDSKYMVIPDRLNLTGAIIAIFVSLWRGFDGIVRSLAGGLIGLLLLTAMLWMGKLFFKREGVGLGDIKLAIVIGLFVGPLWCFITILFAIIIGGMWGIIQLAVGKGVIGKQIPFGPFIAFGGFLVLLFRIQILYLIEQYISLL